jgi:hypothetical protein
MGEETMRQRSGSPQAEVCVSYASQDRERVLRIADALEAAGARVWLDRNRIDGGTNYGPEIARGIKNCKVLMLICSDASMRSRNVRQEIQLAWKYERSYLPVLLEPISFPEQLEYWLEGWQWVEVMDAPPERWLPAVLRALSLAGVRCHPGTGSANNAEAVAQPARPERGLQGLLSVASFTDQIWPVPADRVRRGTARAATRGLGAPQEDVQHWHRLGSRVCLAIESDREGHLLLLDEGPEGIIYCLCPSWFAPDTRLRPGRTYLPQTGSQYDAFVVTGKPGREHLLAIISDEPLSLNWMPPDARIPSRVLTPADVDALLAGLRNLEGDRWVALSTYFDVVA